MIPWYRWPAVWTGVWFTLGCLVRTVSVPTVGVIVAVCSVLILLGLEIRRFRHYRIPILIAVLALNLGFLRTNTAVSRYMHNCVRTTFYRDWHDPVPDPVRWTGTVVGFARPSLNGWSLVVDVDTIEWRRRRRQCTGRVEVWVSVPQEATAPADRWGLPPYGYPGTRIAALGYWTPLVRYRNPGTFRPETRMARGIHGRFRVRHETLIRMLHPGPWYWRVLYRYRESIRHALYRNAAVETSPSSAVGIGLLQAIWLGDRYGMPVELLQALRRWGIYHVVAISGLHVGLLALLLGLLFLRVCRIPPRVGASAIMVGLVGYAMMVGGQPSVVRATAIAVLYLIARYWFLPVHGLNLLAGLWTVLLLARPLWLWDVGFQMTFGITAGLLLAVPPLVRAVTGWRAWVAGAVAVSLIAPLWSAPWVVGKFGGWSWVTAVANLVIAPWVGVLIAIGLLVPVLVRLPGGNLFVSGLIQGIDRGVREGLYPLALRWNTQVPVATTVAHAVGIGLLIGAALVWVAWARSRVPRRVHWIVWTTGYLAVTVLATVPLPQRHRGLDLVLLDVGQGEAILVRSAGATVLVDGGGITGSQWDIGTYVVVPALRAIGVNRVDAVVMTHPHPDHYIGLRAVMETYRVRRLYYPRGTWIPKWLRESPIWPKVRTVAVHEGMAWSTGPVHWRVLNPRIDDPQTNINEGSVVLAITYAGHRILLTGDIERRTEQRLAAEYDDALRADVLKLGHHGSRTSSIPAFVAQVRPRWAVCSAGWRNRYGVPHPDVLARLQRQGARVLCTHTAGMIEIHLTEDGHVRVRTFYGKMGSIRKTPGQSTRKQVDIGVLSGRVHSRQVVPR